MHISKSAVMPPKKHKRLSSKHKSQLQFVEHPKEIPHGLLSPIHCSTFQAGAKLTEIENNNFLWVSPQFTDIKDLPAKHRKRNPKPTCENDYPKEQKRYGSLQFMKPKSLRTAFQNCQSLSNIKDIVISPNFKTSKDTCKVTCPWNLFQNSPVKQENFGEILVPDTPENEYGLSVRHKQLRKKRIK